ncbi:MAG: GIY-YIG nuclease family protein [Flavobacterium sp.]|uniref:GIY-YIG nuclease family protein n=1 Tax=Myroides marinus TaxID=703342 RepID=UPI000741BBC7|nr:GIY-YIG nuclease family protein [Myroides marinus]KUF38970.1 hypothetical protein AS361_03745 [Myroides marinus]
MVYVYRITAPDNKSYIGSTKNIRRRWNTHRSLSRKEHRKLIESFNTYGVDNHLFEVLEKCEDNIRDERETYYGLLFEVLTIEKGLNVRLPLLKDGRGGFCEDYKVWCKGKTLHYDVWNKGGKLHYPIWNKGIPCSEETKLKLSKSKLGKVSPRKGIKTGKPAHNSKVVLDYATGVFYSSVKEAAIAKNMKRQTLSCMLLGHNPNKTNLIYV